MTQVVNLTLPIGPRLPVGHLFPYHPPYRMEPIRSYQSGGAQLEYYQFHSETGTRLATAAMIDPAAATIGEVDFSRLVNRPAVVVDVPKAANEPITAADIACRVEADEAIRPGDALLVRTSWGNGERYRLLGDDYTLRAPYFETDSAGRLAAFLTARGCDLLAIDIPFLERRGACMRDDWLAVPAWQRPPWPSDQARIYLRDWDKDDAAGEWSATRPLYEAALLLVALRNTDAIQTKHVLLTALPLFAEDTPSAPTTVIAREVRV